MSRFDDRVLADLRRANGSGPVTESLREPTWGDVFDVLLGGPAVYVCSHCAADPPRHGVCLGGSGGRTCQCAEGPHPLRR